jgi:hypothetical protein
MPGGDRTGPRGMGPMTGRAAGYCADHDAPGYTNPAPRLGFGMGWRRRGGGWGWRNWYYATGLPSWARGVPGWGPWGYAPIWGRPQAYGSYAAPPTPEQEAKYLKAQAEWLREQLDALNQRIEDLKEPE